MISFCFLTISSSSPMYSSLSLYSISSYYSFIYSKIRDCLRRSRKLYSSSSISLCNVFSFLCEKLNYRLCLLFLFLAFVPNDSRYFYFYFYFCLYFSFSLCLRLGIDFLWPYLWGSESKILEMSRLTLGLMSLISDLA